VATSRVSERKDTKWQDWCLEKQKNKCGWTRPAQTFTHSTAWLVPCFKTQRIGSEKTSYAISYISLCHKAHKALTFSFQPLRFAARFLTFAHDCHPAVFLSSSTILLHVVLGRPGLLFPSGLHSRAVTQCSSLSFLIICPIQFHLLRLISSLVLFTPVFS